MNHRVALLWLAPLVLALAGACSKPPDTAPAKPPPAPAAAAADPAVADAATALALEEVDAQGFEARYLETTDLREKMTLLSNLADSDPRAALPALGRLFHLETDLALKEEILYVLQDVDGGLEEKLLLLAEAVETNQAQQIRLAGIEGLVDLEDQRGVLVMQHLVNDADPEVRQAATDAVEELLEE